MNALPAQILPFSPFVLSNTQCDAMPEKALHYPMFRYMGSKKNLLPWIHRVLSGIDFDSAWDPFSGGGSVAYLLKAMDRRVVASDFLNFPSVIVRALGGGLYIFNMKEEALHTLRATGKLDVIGEANIFRLGDDVVGMLESRIWRMTSDANQR